MTSEEHRLLQLGLSQQARIEPTRCFRLDGGVLHRQGHLTGRRVRDTLVQSVVASWFSLPAWIAKVFPGCREVADGPEPTASLSRHRARATFLFLATPGPAVCSWP